MDATFEMLVQADPAILDEIVRGIRSAGRPRKVVLFGSRARGDSKPDSDYDILVIEDLEEPGWRASVKYYRALRDLGESKDIVVYSPEQVADWANVRQYITTIALREGRVLYEE